VSFLDGGFFLVAIQDKELIEGLARVVR